MKKEVGKWFMDVAKYVATAVVISSFLDSFQQQWIMYVVGLITIIATFSIGLYFINNKKE